MSDPAVRRLGDAYEKTLDPAGRRLSGAYYTPDYIVRFIVRETLGSLVGHGLGSARILELRVLDPAMGAGHFLAASAEYLLASYRQSCHREGAPPHPAAGRIIVEHCLYGVDTDPEAVLLARRTLALLAGIPEDASAALAAHLVCADALGDHFDWSARFPDVFHAPEAGFAAIIGNPPYLRERDHRKRFAEVRRSEFGRRYATSKMNYWYFFAHRSLELLADGGLHSFVAPAYWPWSDSATRLIRHIQQKHFVRLYVDLGRNRVFDAVSDRLSLYVLEQRQRGADPESQCVLFEPGLSVDALRQGLDRLPEATPGVTRIARRSWSEVASGGLLQLGVNPPPGPRAAEITLAELGFLVTQGIAQNPDRVSTRNVRAAAAHYGVTPEELLLQHQVSVGDGVFVLRDAELESLRLSADELALFGPYFDAEQLCHRSGLPPNGQWLLYSAPETSDRVRASATLMRHLARFRFLTELRRETRAGSRPWWEMHWPRRREWFSGPRLIVPQLSACPFFVYADTPGFVNLSVNVIVCPDPLAAKLLWVLLNGPQTRERLLASTKRRGASVDLGVACLRRIPVPSALPWQELRSGAGPMPEAVRMALEAFDSVRSLEAAGAGPEAVDPVLADAAAMLQRAAESSRSRR